MFATVLLLTSEYPDDLEQSQRDLHHYIVQSSECSRLIVSAHLVPFSAPIYTWL